VTIEPSLASLRAVVNVGAIAKVLLDLRLRLRDAHAAGALAWGGSIMPLLVVGGAQLTCSKGSSPGLLMLLDRKVTACTHNAATRDDTIGVPSFDQCSSQSNPNVKAATERNKKPTTAGCTPNLMPQWSPDERKVTAEKKVSLGEDAKLVCLYDGKITVKDAGQAKVSIT
jgi:hypothetical protein